MFTKINKKRIFWMLCVFVFLLILHYIKIISPLENLLIKISNPVRNSIYNSSRGVNSYFYSIFHYKQIKSDEESMKNQMSQYLIDKSYIKKLEDENKILKDSLDYKNNSKQNIILSEVVSGFYMGNKSLITLNKGSKDGVDIGMPVVYAKGIIVGTIIDVSNDRSHALLLSDKNSVFTTIIQGDEKLTGVVRGDLDYGLQMDYIPIDSSIKEGDIVTTSGLEEKIPKGLVIGQVKKLIFNEGDFFKRAVIYAPVDYQMLDLVGIIQK